VPTFKEQGLDIVFSNWMGVAVPKEMPIEVKTKLADGLKAIILDPEFKIKLENIGLQVDYFPPPKRLKRNGWMIVKNYRFKEQRNKSN